MKNLISFFAFFCLSFAASAETLQPKVEDLTLSAPLVLALSKVQKEFTSFMTFGNTIQKIESKVLMDSATYILVVANCSYDNRGRQTCLSGATMEIQVLVGGRFVGATVTPN